MNTSGKKFPGVGDDLGDNIALNNKEHKDIYYNDLWDACAGPNACIPLRGERVFYFPQGHAEQVQAYCTSQDGSTNFPVYNVPSEILCKVASIALKAEDVTDEVFAQITLLTGNEKGATRWTSDNAIIPFPPKRAVFSFSKPLTPSDTSTHGGFSVPKRYADECFPRLDMSLQPPVQELGAKDVNGFEWRFRHIYRGQPRRHLLTSGWSAFVTAKKLVAGDACVFLRGENGELRVGVRHAMKRQTPKNLSSSVISDQCMKHGILASAYHAISYDSIFVVFHRPWRYPHFVVSYDRYMESTKIYYVPGMKFRFDFEGDGFVEKRVTGTIIDVGDQDPIRWPNSKWKCLKVHWDGSSNASSLPERLSPWEIKLISANRIDSFVAPPLPKRRELDLPFSGFPGTMKEGLMINPIKPIPLRQKEVLQGQEISDARAHELSTKAPPVLLPQITLPPAPDQKRTELLFPINPLPENESTVTAGPSVWSLMPSARRGRDNIEISKNFSVSNVTSSYSVSQECDQQRSPCDEASHRQSNERGKVIVFGVNFSESNSELPSLQGEVLGSSVCPISQSNGAGLGQVPKKFKTISGSLAEKQCKRCYSISSRSCTKVIKYGTALGRSVDLSNFNGHKELISELDQIFEFDGSLVDGSSGWKVTFMDNEGDLMLIGDYEWQVFRAVVRKMFVCPKEELDRLRPEALKTGIFVTDD